MSKRGSNLRHILIVGAALAALSGALHARDPGINQPGAAGNVGGVARRRIVATSVYVATLPAPCTAVVIEGATLQQCGGVYYQASGKQYVVVKVE